MDIFDENHPINKIRAIYDKVPGMAHLSVLTDTLTRFKGNNLITESSGDIIITKKGKVVCQKFEDLFTVEEYKIVVKCMVDCRIKDRAGNYINRASLPKYRLHAFCSALNSELLDGERSLIEISRLLQKELNIPYTKLKESTKHDDYLKEYRDTIKGLKSNG
jgi:hypothetical protein